MSSKRASVQESAISGERAIPEESTTRKERASVQESTSRKERARSPESTKTRRAYNTGEVKCMNDQESIDSNDQEYILPKVTKELRQEAQKLPQEQARYLVDAYYQLQRYRIAAENQLRMEVQDTDHPPVEIITWLATNTRQFENRIKSLLGAYADNSGVGHWSLGICGIGPVLAAGLLAHIDIRKAPTAGHIWRFAGLDPTQPPAKKGEKRSWNARLKTLCWKIGESFVKVSGREQDVYGKVYQGRKAWEEERNLAGEYADQAAAILQAKNWRADTKAKGFYEQGLLPPDHIHARAKRYAVKLFLSHWQEVAWYAEYGERAPAPYPIAVLAHGHRIQAPNWSFGGRERGAS